jgi:transposase
LQYRPERLPCAPFCGLDELGLQVTGQRLEPGRAVLACRVLDSDDWCHRCGGQGVARDTVTRRLAHEPLGWRPTTLLVTVRRYRCLDCAHVRRQDTSRAAEPRAKLSRRALRWALTGIVCQHLSVSRVAEGLAVSWDTASDAVLAEGRRVLINDPNRFDCVRVIGAGEHYWRHTRRGDKFVTVIIDLTPVRDQSGPARPLDMVEGRSKQVFKTWLAARSQQFRAGIDVVAMSPASFRPHPDGLVGEHLPQRLRRGLGYPLGCGHHGHRPLHCLSGQRARDQA